MYKKLLVGIVLLMVMIACITALAAEKGKSQVQATSSQKAVKQVEKESFSTDLGKGLPYPGLTTQEQNKLAEISKEQQMQRPAQANNSPKPIIDVKPTLVPASRPQNIPSSIPVKPHEKGRSLTTDSNSNGVYPGLSPQEQEKHQAEGGK